MSKDLTKGSNTEVLKLDTAMLCGTKHSLTASITGTEAYKDKIIVNAKMQDTGGMGTGYHYGNGYLHKLRVEILNGGKIVHQEDISGDDTGNGVSREYLINAPGRWDVQFKSKSAGDCAKPNGTQSVGYFWATAPAKEDDDNAGDGAPIINTNEYAPLIKTGLILGAALVLGKMMTKKSKKAAETSQEEFKNGDILVCIKDSAQGNFKIGDYATVGDVDLSGRKGVVEMQEGTKSWLIFSHYFKKVNDDLFKNGDILVCIKDSPKSHFKIGDYATFVEEWQDQVLKGKVRLQQDDKEYDYGLTTYEYFRKVTPHNPEDNKFKNGDIVELLGDVSNNESYIGKMAIITSNIGRNDRLDDVLYVWSAIDSGRDRGQSFGGDLRLYNPYEMMLRRRLGRKAEESFEASGERKDMWIHHECVMCDYKTEPAWLRLAKDKNCPKCEDEKNKFMIPMENTAMMLFSPQAKVKHWREWHSKGYTDEEIDDEWELRKQRLKKLGMGESIDWEVVDENRDYRAEEILDITAIWNDIGNESKLMDIVQERYLNDRCVACNFRFNKNHSFWTLGDYRICEKCGVDKSIETYLSAEESFEAPMKGAQPPRNSLDQIGVYLDKSHTNAIRTALKEKYNDFTFGVKRNGDTIITINLISGKREITNWNTMEAELNTLAIDTIWDLEHESFDTKDEMEISVYSFVGAFGNKEYIVKEAEEPKYEQNMELIFSILTDPSNELYGYGISGRDGGLNNVAIISMMQYLDKKDMCAKKYKNWNSWSLEKRMKRAKRFSGYMGDRMGMLNRSLKRIYRKYKVYDYAIYKDAFGWIKYNSKLFLIMSHYNAGKTQIIIIYPLDSPKGMEMFNRMEKEDVKAILRPAINNKKLNAESITTNTSNQLFKKASSGEIRQWTGWVESIGDGEYTLKVITGVVDGKQTPTKGKVYSSGKQGRDAKSQAEFELVSKINKKRDEGYFDTIQEAQNSRVILPMLAVDFKKRGHSIKFPAIGQRKFDGVRCLAEVQDDGSVALNSRKGKPFPHLNHLRTQIAGLKNLPSNVILDGELYSDTLTFQEVVGLVRRATLKAGDEEKLKQISYRLYDLIPLDDDKMDFENRYEILTKIDLDKNINPNLILTENVELTDASEVDKYHNQFVQEGYEGIMVRNREGEYGLNKRSKHLQKYKKFLDDEFEIVGYFEGTGNDAGTVIWLCKNAKGQTFKARPTGTREQRKEWFQKGDSLIGSTLTVRYFELTDDGIPRFPVGIAIRDYE